MNSLTGSRVRQATSTAWGLALCLALAECNAGHSHRLDPSPFNTPPLNAYALSGGKITRFIGNPELPADPTARPLLQACRSLPRTSRTAQSVYVMFKSRFGVTPIPALRVGGATLVLVGSVERMLVGEANHLTAAILTLPGGTRRAKIGNKWVNLRYPVIAVNGGAETVMALPDLLALFQAADEQRGGGHEIQYVKTQYDLNPALLYPASRR